MAALCDRFFRSASQSKPEAQRPADDRGREGKNRQWERVAKGQIFFDNLSLVQVYAAAALGGGIRVAFRVGINRKGEVYRIHVLINTFHYRPEVDGFRAIAILAVVLHHAGFGCSGGYVGVDLFYVISGYLITSLIWKDLESARFTFVQFWERRARRIVPALVAVTLAILAVGFVIFLPADLRVLGRAAASQALFAANFNYWLEGTGYFTGIADEKPLLHTWSLAVEEQFYLLAPFLLWGLFRLLKARTRTSVVCVLVVLSGVSFAWNLYAISRFPSMTFYLLPARAWELLLGSIVAFCPAVPSWKGRRIPWEFCSLGGLALVLFSIVFYTRGIPYPGIAALLPCLGIALMIWASGFGPTGVGALFSLRPLVFVGLISYSLYLWHWPLLAFSKYVALAPLSFPYRALVVAAGFLLAWLSWKFIETPFRLRRVGATPTSMALYAGAGLIAVFGFGLLCRVMQGFPQRFSPQALAFARDAVDMSFYHELVTADIRAGKLTPVGEPEIGRRPSLLVWGDSHAMAVLPAIDAFLKEKGLAGTAAVHSSTPPVLGWRPMGENEFRDALAFNDAVFAHASRGAIPDVMMIASWGHYIEPGQPRSEQFKGALLRTVQRLAESGCRPWVLLDVPIHSFPVSRALALHFEARPASLTPFQAKPGIHHELDDPDSPFRKALEAAGGRILDPKPSFRDAASGCYRIETNGISLYRDQDHLTPQGARLMLLPLLREAMPEIRARAPGSPGAGFSVH